MNAATLLALCTLALLVPGLIISLYIDKHGLPAAWDNQTTPRKRGTLGPRLPLIGFNLAMVYGSAIPALYFYRGLFPLSVPPWWMVIFQVIILMLVDDAWFYLIHRHLHTNKTLYKRIHKLHHEAFAPVPIEYIYAHPLEWSSGALGPVFAITGILLWQGEMSAYVLIGWQSWRVLHELDIHSGLRSPLTARIPLWASMKHHDLHHARPTQGNYASSFTIWDKVFGTCIAEKAE